AVDMKGGVAAFLGALRALDAAGAEPRSFRLALVPDEEIGGPLGADVVRRYGPLSDEMWVLEPGQPADGGETVVLGRWGLVTWSLDARGVAAHSGLDFERGRSALAAAARWVDRAQALSEPDLASVNAAAFISPATPPTSQGPLSDEPPPLNVVPESASVGGEVRFAERAVGDRVLDALRILAEQVSADTGVELRFTVHEEIPAYAATQTTTESAWLARRFAAAEACGLRLEIEASRRGVSFSNFVPPTPQPLRVLDGLGPVGGGMHTEQEWVSLESLHRRTAWLARMLIDPTGKLYSEYEDCDLNSRPHLRVR
ncbi:MAG: M20/M25/M40 family metallo-hydrolase, partial [Acidobacteriota bacterium]